MISITSLTGSTNGVIFQEDQTSRLKQVEPRITKSKTLDGGVYIDHRGVVDGDREIRIIANLDQSTADALQTIYESETIVNMACLQGFYAGSIATMQIDNGQLDMEFWVSDSLTVETVTARYVLESESITLTEFVNASVA